MFDVILNTSHVIISEETIEGYVSSKFAQGIVVISKEISESEEEEGLVRDIIRRIQFMRKQLKLNVVDYIEISIKAPEERVKTIQKWEEFIKSETRGNKVILGDPKGDIVMDWDIEGESYIIGIKKST